MAECLGLYIENNLIKYAKVSKNNEAIKVESFGIKFYDDNIEKTIKQIIEETYSYNKTSISINASDEVYNKFEMFSQLKPRDINEVVKTEFENACYDAGTTPNVFEQRSILAGSKENVERIRAISIAVPKTIIEQRKNQLNKNKVSAMFSESVALTKIINPIKKGTDLIINIEKNTTITKITDGIISDINLINIGIQNIIENIQKKENSYAKAYEICKSTTIYLDSDKDLEYEENEYLVDIMPVLYELVTQIKKYVDESLDTIDNIYITGTAAVINNIDIYFQDYFNNISCEILRPSFIGKNSKLNIKDYIEVNSAIALAVSAFDSKEPTNFVKQTNLNNVSDFLKTDISTINFKDLFNKLGSISNTKYSFIYFTMIMSAVSYIAVTSILNAQFNKKIQLANTSISDTKARISNVEEYTRKFNSKTTEYKKLITSIENSNNIAMENRRYRKTIPRLLNNIMAVIPKNVQVISIENKTDSHVVIVARSTKYEQLAMFKTKLQTEEILEKVTSDTGTISGDYAVVTIEGELP